ncbi:MAG: cupin domain-containing protein [Acidobacteriota bacterium]
MGSHHPTVFHYPNVLDSKQHPRPAIFSQATTPGLDKPEGFRIPLVYFSWGVLEGSRSAHHHPDNDELLLVLKGKGKINLIGPGKPKMRLNETYEVSKGDVVLFPQGWTHSVEEDPYHPLRVLVIFNTQDFKAVEHEQDDAKMHLGENF